MIMFIIIIPHPIQYIRPKTLIENTLKKKTKQKHTHKSSGNLLLIIWKVSLPELFGQFGYLLGPTFWQFCHMRQWKLWYHPAVEESNNVLNSLNPLGKHIIDFNIYHRTIQFNTLSSQEHIKVPTYYIKHFSSWKNIFLEIHSSIQMLDEKQIKLALN